MSNEILNPNVLKYDLKERTAKFGEDVIEFCQSLERNEINRPLISQLIRAATSPGANYMEADGAESRKDFEHKVGICRKETKECMHWFRMVVKANPGHATQARKLYREAQELTFIFSAIIKSSKTASLKNRTNG